MTLVPANFTQLADLIRRQRPYKVQPNSVLMPDLSDPASYHGNHLPDGTPKDEEQIDIFGEFAQFGSPDPVLCPGGLLELTVMPGPPESVGPLNPVPAPLKGISDAFKLTVGSQDYNITKGIRIPYRYKIIQKTVDAQGNPKDVERDVFAHIFVLYNGSGQL